MRAKALAMVGREDDDRVLRQAQLVHRAHQAADVVVQVGDHGVVAAHPARQLFALRVRQARPFVRVRVILRQIVVRQLERHILHALQVFGGHVVGRPGIVRRTDGEEEREGPVPGGEAAQLADGHVGHAVGLIAVVIDLLRRVQVVVGMWRVVLVVEAVVGKKAVEPEPVRPLGHERVLRVVVVAQLIGVQMPLADVGRLIAALIQHMRDAAVVGADADLVDDHAGRGRVLACEQRRAEGRAHGVAGDRVAQVQALRAQRVDVGREAGPPARVADGGVAQLIGKHEEQVGPLGGGHEQDRPFFRPLCADGGGACAPFVLL